MTSALTAGQADATTPDAVTTPRSLWKTIQPLGSPSVLRQGEVLALDGGLLIQSGAVALLSDTDGKATCVGLMTDGDLAGLEQVVSAQPIRHRLVVIAGGVALCFPRLALRREWETSAFFREAVVLEAHLALETARQWSLCQERHSARQRLATLLLWLSDNGGDGRMSLSQETAAEILNVRRTTVVASVADLKAVRAITWRRGLVDLTDPTELSRHACSCARRR